MIESYSSFFIGFVGMGGLIWAILIYKAIAADNKKLSEVLMQEQIISLFREKIPFEINPLRQRLEAHAKYFDQMQIQIDELKKRRVRR